MKEKYVDERFPFWFKLGSSADGRVGLTSGDGEVDVLVPEDVADQLLAEHNRVQAQLVACALAFNAANPEAFDKFWYGA